MNHLQALMDRLRHFKSVRRTPPHHLQSACVDALERRGFTVRAPQVPAGVLLLALLLADVLTQEAP
jgi:hypothetical protein